MPTLHGDGPGVGSDVPTMRGLQEGAERDRATGGGSGGAPGAWGETAATAALRL